MRPPQSLANVSKLSRTQSTVNAKPDSISERSISSSSGLGSSCSFMLARLVRDETDESTKWECNETKSKGNDPFFSTHTGDLEGGSTNDIIIWATTSVQRN